jgi:hypothetical protein
LVPFLTSSSVGILLSKRLESLDTPCSGVELRAP